MKTTVIQIKTVLPTMYKFLKKGINKVSKETEDMK